MATPLIHRRFQYTDLSNNNNKVWEIQYYPDGRLVRTYGRVGSKLSPTETFNEPRSAAERYIREKLREGYTEVQLHEQVAVAAPTRHRQNGPEFDFLDRVFKEAGQSISGYLSVKTSDLSQTQIDRAKIVLTHIANLIASGKMPSDAQVSNLVEEYYNLIPTKLPHRIQREQVVRDFCLSLSEHSDRLEQLETAISSVGQSADPVDALGIKMKLISPMTMEFKKLAALFDRTYHAPKAIYAVEIPTERKAFDAETFGAQKVVTLFHGTYPKNLFHILRTGLVVPRVAAHGRRCGDGIYFAEDPRRSMNYTSSGSHVSRICFIADVKMGSDYSVSGTYSGKEAPRGYQSVRGTHAHGGLGDEIIVYKQSQQTIRAIVEL